MNKRFMTLWLILAILLMCAAVPLIGMITDKSAGEGNRGKAIDKGTILCYNVLQKGCETNAGRIYIV